MSRRQDSKITTPTYTALLMNAFGINYQAFIDAYQSADQDRLFYTVMGLMLVLPPEVEADVAADFENIMDGLTELQLNKAKMLDELRREKSWKIERRNYLYKQNLYIIKKIYRSMSKNGWFTRETNIKPLVDNPDVIF